MVWCMEYRWSTKVRQKAFCFWSVGRANTVNLNAPPLDSMSVLQTLRLVSDKCWDVLVRREEPHTKMPDTMSRTFQLLIHFDY
jgi:hypothetical protein